MASEKETYSIKQGWVTLAMVLLVSFIFGLVVLPRLDEKASTRLEGEVASDFALPLLDGGEPGDRIRLSNLAGQVVVLDFWATWCPPCLEQIPILSQVAQATEDAAVSVIGVNTGDSLQDATRLLGKLRPLYPMLSDTDGTVAALYGVETLPTLIVVSPKGTIHAVRHGVQDGRALRSLIQSAASERR